MARHDKARGLEITPSHGLNVTINFEESDDEHVPSLSQKQPAKQKRKQKKKYKQQKSSNPAVTETPTDSDQDELGVEPRGVQKIPRKKNISAAEARKEKVVLQALEKATTLIASMGEKEDIESILRHAARRNDSTLSQMQKCRDVLSILLSSATSPTGQGINSKVPSTIHLYDKYFAYQGPSKQLYILRPVEVIQGNVNLTRSKVAGFIQHKGSNFPLKYALPGWVPCTESHPNVLESAYWTDQVRQWGEFHHHRFPGNPFEKHHGKAKGHAGASHVEGRLMIWYACDRLQELRGDKQPVRIGDLWRLRDYEKEIEAEVFLTRAPCDKCLEMKKLIEEYTRIVFHIQVIPNLGELQPERNKHGWVTFPRYATNHGDEEDEEEKEKEVEVLEEEIVEKSRRTIEVVIRSNHPKPSTASRAIEQQPQQQRSPPSTKTSIITETKTKTCTTKQKRHIQSFSFNPTPQISAKQASYNSDSDDPSYELPVSRSKPKTQMSPSKTPNQNAYRNASVMPGGNPFGEEARRQAELLRREKQKKKKRARETETSPMTAKKSRHMRFD